MVLYALNVDLFGGLLWCEPMGETVELQNHECHEFVLYLRI